MPTELETKRLSVILREMRGAQSQRAFATTIGITYTTIQNWETGAFYPREDKLIKIAAKLGWTPEELDKFLKLGIRPNISESLSRILDAIGMMHEPDLLKVQFTCLNRMQQIVEIRYPDRISNEKANEEKPETED